MSTTTTHRTDSSRPDRPRSHREALLEGAIKCIQKKGYARTTARDIVAASETNLASIGYHFGSTEELLNEAIAEGFRRWLAQLAAVALGDQNAPALERLRRSLVAWSDSFEDNRHLIVGFVEALAQSTHSEELRQTLAAQYQEARLVVAAMVRESLSTTDHSEAIDASTVASVLIGMADGLMLQWILEPERVISGDELLSSIEDATKLIAAGKC